MMMMMIRVMETGLGNGDNSGNAGNGSGNSGFNNGGNGNGDNTTALGNLPKTGVSAVLGASVIIMGVVSAVIYKKYNSYKDI